MVSDSEFPLNLSGDGWFTFFHLGFAMSMMTCCTTEFVIVKVFMIIKISTAVAWYDV